MENIIQIYGQDSPHSEALIVSDKEGLILLREAIDKALKSGQGVLNTFQSDGEGYQLIILKQKEDKIKELRSSYIDEIYVTGGKKPWSLIDWEKC